MTVRRTAPILAVIGAAALLGACAATETSQSTGEFIANEALVADVKTQLAQADLETLLDIEVEAFRNVVQLNGFVETEEEKMRAEEVAAAVDGVEEVQNNLAVKSNI